MRILSNLKMLHSLMKSKKLSRTVRYSANEMYALVSDIESYPYFVPACKSLKVLKRRKDGDIIYIDAIMEVGYGFLNESFTSNIILNKNKFTIEVVNSDGPFRKLNNYWQFIDIENGSEILFEIDFIAKNSLTGKVINLMFERVFSKYIFAFESRANKLYS
tara:strand:- start:729 stop:1211 length:483 start_codon:yes stop_codon:yes gene_type:complete